MLTLVIVNDVIILLTLTTRPKEERSNAFHCPPEVRAVNDRMLVSMNHLDQLAHLSWHSRSRSQRHYCKISRMSIWRTARNDDVTYLRRSRGHTYSIRHSVIAESHKSSCLPAVNVYIRVRPIENTYAIGVMIKSIKRCNKRHSFLLARQGTVLVIVIA